MLEIKLFHVPISGGPFSKTLMYTKASAPQSVHVLNCTFPAICKCFLYYFLFTLTSTVPLQFMSFQLRNKRLALNQKRNKDTNCDSSHFNSFLFFIFIFLNETRIITGKKSADAWKVWLVCWNSISYWDSLNPVLPSVWSQDISTNSDLFYIRFTQWELTSWQVTDFTATAIKSGVY